MSFIKPLGFMFIVTLAIIYLTHLGLDMARGASLTTAGQVAWLKSGAYLSQLAQGDFGLTAAGTLAGLPTPVAAVVPDLFTKSLGLLLPSLLFATIVGVMLGTWAAQYPRGSLIFLMGSIVAASLPSFMLAPMLQISMIQWTHYFGSPLLPLGGFGWDKRLILPALVLAARPIAQITRVTFLTMSNLWKQDFARVAASKGLRDIAILRGHLFRNAAIPILTTLIISLRFSLSSLPVVEYFFGWPGVGFSLLKAIARQDDNLTVGLILGLAWLFMGVNLLLELTYPFIDPRLQTQTAAPQPHTAFWPDLKDLLRSLLPTRQNPSAPPRPALRPPTPPTPAQLAQERQLQRHRRRLLWQQTVGNLPLMIGLGIGLGLLGIILFGPAVSPHSPFTTQGMVMVQGKPIIPPFPPDAIYPLGTDILGRDMASLLLAGTRQTLFLASVVVLARLAIGFLSGALAGWFNGHWPDRLLLTLAALISAFPTLLLTMLLILAWGIRQGLSPFILAFSMVGWGEVMQFIRSEVITIRPKLFIESGRAIGLSTPRLIFNHVLPNLIPSLISLAALEMGAVMVLLGELGFIGIFIGGGTLAETTRGLYHYSDLPEWGALLSNIRAYSRSYSWLAIYPTLAFFITILGFNLLGEGLRRLVDNVGFTFTHWLNRYTLTLALGAVMGFNWLQNNTGSVAFYRDNAQQFHPQLAYEHIAQLSDPQLQGRALGTVGASQAAEYIGAQFAALGLQSAGEGQSYFYPRKRSFEQLDQVPTLTLFDGGTPPVYQQDYNTFVSPFRNIGQAEGLVRFIATGPLQSQRSFGLSYPALTKRHYEQEVLLVLSAPEANALRTIPHAAILVVTTDPLLLQRNHTLLARNPLEANFGTNRFHKQDSPMLWIHEDLANRLLAGTGQTVATLRLQQARLIKDQLFELPTDQSVALSVQGTVYEKQQLPHVLGYIPGSMGVTGSRSLDSQLLIVMAQYDSPPLNPDGQLRSAANHYGSAVGLMLELIHTLQSSGYQPFKTILFVAYSGEGMEGGEVVTPPKPSDLLQIRRNFGADFEVEAVVILRGLGAGPTDTLALSVKGSQRLGYLFERAAGQFSLSTTRLDEGVNLAFIFDNARLTGGEEAPQITLQWAGSDTLAHTPHDTLQNISLDKLNQAGQAITLALMIMGREKTY